MASWMEEKESIRDTLARYCFYFDNGEFDKWVELFTEDGVFDVGPMGKFVGRRELGKFLKEIPLTDGQPRMKHLVTNILIHVTGSEARAESYFVVFRPGEKGLTTSVAGRYQDVLVKKGDAWLFRQRKIHLDMIGELGLER